MSINGARAALYRSHLSCPCTNIYGLEKVILSSKCFVYIDNDGVSPSAHSNKTVLDTDKQMHTHS